MRGVLADLHARIPRPGRRLLHDRQRRAAGVERLEVRLAPATVAGTITQGNLDGAQSIVLATPIQRQGQPTEIEVIDTGDIGMGRQSVRSFIPFRTFGVPLIMDIHGGNIQAGVDAGNRPVGVVEPAGPELRSWFVSTLPTRSARPSH